jgi:ubiquinol-cytochrome c reductase cytochrome c1 subunit
MITTKSIFAAALIALALVASPVGAQEHAVTEIQKQPWSFAGVFGTYDENQLQRGFQVFREVCSSCHGARLLAFRNLAERGGPGFSEDQVKALAAEYEIVDADAAGGVRPGVAADRWPSPFASDQEARDAMGGALPPDFSVIAKARGTTQPFPWWILNYFTGYSEGGPDYIHALLNSYHDEPPADIENFPADQYYNEVFPGNAIGMAPPLQDELVAYEDPAFPQTTEQYSRDVAAFLMWVAEPHLVERKETGFKVILFLVLFAGLMWLVKQRLWSRVEH